MHLNSIHTIDDFDWRLEKIIPIQSIKQGIWPTINSWGYVTLSWAFKLPWGKDEILFDIPNMSAVLLEQSNKLYQMTNEYLKFENFPRKNSNRVIKDYDYFIEILQSRIWSVIFAFLALETFMNDCIPDGYEFNNGSNIFKTRRWSPKTLDKVFIINDVTIKNKFEYILADIYNKKPIKAEVLDEFTKIKNLRDRLTHLKDTDKSSCSSSQDTIWKAILNKDFPNYAIIVKNIIWYFIEDFDEDSRPRWLKKIAF